MVVVRGVDASSGGNRAVCGGSGGTREGLMGADSAIEAAVARATDGARRARKLDRASGWIDGMDGGVNGWWVGEVGVNRWLRKGPRRISISLQN